ncbi:MAG: replication-associated recombination protein A [Pseudomonadota bacterium]
MSDLFQSAGLTADAPQPLADALRPSALSAVVGQDHLVGTDGTLRRLISAGALPSIILWGPPGVGKTTIAQLLAAETSLHFEALSAVFSGVKDLRAVFDRAEARRASGQGTLLFVDEIHRFNRAQQDGFLPFVERGTITLVGATTENPSFEVNGALLSRCTVLTLRNLDEAALDTLLVRASKHVGRELPLTADARRAMLAMASGDGRYLLNLAEQVFAVGGSDGEPMGIAELEGVFEQRAAAYDKDRDGHYNLISALHKSVRGSDPDAALYWFSRMLEGGEDPLFLARRLVRMASEDIGLADPTALLIAGEAARTYERLGSPEGELALAQAVLHLATAPKSNAAYVAYKAARKAAASGSPPPPKTILNAPTALMRDQGYGDGYIYDHDTEEGFSGQTYFPDGMERPVFYAPKSVGREVAIAERMDVWKRLRANRADRS